MGRINVLMAEPWFEPYKIYDIEIAQRKSIRKLILKMKLNEVLTIVEKRNEFLFELERRLFDLNRDKSIRKKSVSQTSDHYLK